MGREEGQPQDPVPDSVKQAAEDIKQSFSKTAHELRELVNQQNEEIRQHGETSKKTAENIATVEKKLAGFEEEKNELLKQVEELDKKISRRGLEGEKDERLEEKTLGQLFTDSDAYKEMVEKKRSESERFEFKGRWDQLSRKDLLDLGASGTAAGIAQPYRVPDIVQMGMRRMRIRDLMNVVTLESTDSVQYVRETGFSVLFTTTTTTQAGTDTQITVENAVGFYAGQSITIAGDGGNVTATVQSVNIDTGVITLTAQIGDTVSSGARVTSQSMAGTPTSELKPDMDLNIALRTQAVVTVAGTVTVPRQALADVNRLRNYIDTKMIYSLQLSEEAHILYGDGSEEMMPGILNDADRQTQLWSAGETGDTRIDAIRRAATKVMLADYEPNGVVLHPNDWQEIEMAKGSDNHYIWVTVTRGGQQLLWAMPVVPTRAISEGTGVAGAWGLGGVLYDREQSSIRAFEQHSDYAKRNLALLLGEERATVTWERPESFCEISFDSAPA